VAVRVVFASSTSSSVANVVDNDKNSRSITIAGRSIFECDLKKYHSIKNKKNPQP